MQTTRRTADLYALLLLRIGSIGVAVAATVAGCSDASKGPSEATSTTRVEAGGSSAAAAPSVEDGGSTASERDATADSLSGSVGARATGEDAGTTHTDSGRLDATFDARADAVDSATQPDGADASAGSVDAHRAIDAAKTSPLDASAAPMGDAEAGAPALTYVGRFDTSDPMGPQMGWPGTQIVARFDGTAVSAQLTQTDGYSGGPSWFNVIIDGVEGTPWSLTGSSVAVPLASGLAPGVHVLQLEKRTEANLGVVRFEGFTFTGGSGLLPPSSRAPHRIEFLGDSTIDGYGVLGNMSTTCPTGDPPQYNDSRSSMAYFTAAASNAEMVLSAYSGKGLTVNEDPQDTEYFGVLYPRALPDSSLSIWSFQQDVPDAVVIGLGGVDMDGLSAAPPGFQAAYDSLVGVVRGHYPSASIWLTVWSQITDSPVATRTAMTNTLQSIISARAAAGDHELFLYVFPEATAADETGCEGHANVAHEQAMGALMAAEIQQQLGW